MARLKRTYNLAEATINRVRELSERYEAAPTQDAVVELAVERLYLELLDQLDADRWAAAAADPDFQAEMRQVDRDLAKLETLPPA